MGGLDTTPATVPVRSAYMREMSIASHRCAAPHRSLVVVLPPVDHIVDVPGCGTNSFISTSWHIHPQAARPNVAFRTTLLRMWTMRIQHVAPQPGLEINIPC